MGGEYPGPNYHMHRRTFIEMSRNALRISEMWSSLYHRQKNKPIPKHKSASLKTSINSLSSSGICSRNATLVCNLKRDLDHLNWTVLYVVTHTLGCSARLSWDNAWHNLEYDALGRAFKRCRIVEDAAGSRVFQLHCIAKPTIRSSRVLVSSTKRE